MPHHEIYILLTGATRLRRGWFGRMIVQVQTTEGFWRDANERELRQIGFEASSSKGRQIEDRRAKEWYRDHPDIPPPPLPPELGWR